MRKYTLLILLAGLLDPLSADEISMMDTQKWHSHYPASQITTSADGVITLTNGASFEYTGRIAVDPSRRYSITMEACSSAPDAMVSFAYVPYTADGRQINTENIVCAIKSQTTIAEDAKVGDTVIKVKDISGFIKDLMGNCLLGIDSKEDFSDLPNFHLVKLKADKEIPLVNGSYALKLAAPLKAPLKSGTPVRQHYYGSAFYFTHGMRQKMQPAWKSYEAHLVGIARQCSPVKFPRCTATIKVQIFFDMPKSDTAQIRHLKLTVLPK